MSHLLRAAATSGGGGSPPATPNLRSESIAKGATHYWGTLVKTAGKNPGTRDLIHAINFDTDTRFTDLVDDVEFSTSGTLTHQTGKVIDSLGAGTGPSNQDFAYRASTSWVPGTGDFTYSCWVKSTDTTTPRGQRLGVWAANTAVVTDRWGLVITNDGGGKPRWFEQDTLLTLVDYASAPALNDGSWHHVVHVRRSNGNYSCWVDGVEYTQTSIVVRNVANPGSREFSVAMSNNLIANALEIQGQLVGELDDCRVYDRALSNDEILYLLNQGNSPNVLEDDVGSLDLTGYESWEESSRYGAQGSSAYNSSDFDRGYFQSSPGALSAIGTQAQSYQLLINVREIPATFTQTAFLYGAVGTGNLVNLAINSAGEFSCGLQGGNKRFLIPASALNDWVLVVVTLPASGTANDFRLFVDGVELSSSGTTNPTQAANTAAGEVTIGLPGDRDYTNIFSGAVAGAAIYVGTELTPVQVNELAGQWVTDKALFTPSDLATPPELWVRGSDGFTDLSTNGHTVTNNGATVNASALNGHDVFGFAGTGEYFDVGTVLGKPENFSIACVMRTDLSTTRFAFGSGPASGASVDAWGCGVVSAGGETSLSLQGCFSDGANFRTSAPTSATFTLSQHELVSYTFETGDAAMSMYVDGVAQTTNETGTATSNGGTAYGFSVGRLGQFPSNTLQGEVAELLIFDETLSPSARTDVERYLRSRYAL